jgi:pimeloyl-ACP methyl ester carboxylesterase
MTTFVLVPGAWHGSWAWDRVVPCLEGAGARTVALDLAPSPGTGLRDHARHVAAALAGAPGEPVVLVGHSYGALVVREAADLVPDRVSHVVLVDGWAGPDGSSLFSLAPDAFVQRMRDAADGDGLIPAFDPAPLVDDPADADWLRPRLRPQPLLTFTEPTALTGAVDRIPGTGIHCRPPTYPFEKFARDVGYEAIPLDGPHDIMLARPEPLSRLLLDTATASRR